MTFTNLPVQLTSFIGREQEMAKVKELLATTRLLTLTGPGGCGKTRLAIEVARSLPDQYVADIRLVELASLADPALVPQTVAAVFDLRETSIVPMLTLLADYLREKELLLILDNCEHVVDACARLLKTLLSACARLRVLATSREALSIPAETAWLVPSLSLPDPLTLERGTRGITPPLQSDALDLFVARARAVLPTFQLTHENASTIIQVCQRLDGIPLAIELAAARVKVLTVQQIAQRLDRAFVLLTSGNRSALLPRHQTLRATMDWSYALLSEPERLLFQRLAVFPGRFTLDVAESVCAGVGIEREHVLELLAHLVDKSLVGANTQVDGEARYHLLETIRQYAFEKLEASGEATYLRARHLDLFVSRAEETVSKLHGADQQHWFNWLAGELDNMRVALDWAAGSGRVEAGLRLATALFVFWSSRGSMPEGRDWLERLLAQVDEQASILVRARATTYAGLMAGFLGDVTAARVHGRTAVALCRAAGEAGLPLLALAQAPEVVAAMVDRDFAGAFRLVERIVQLLRQVGDDVELIMALGTQAEAAMGIGKLQLARSLADEALSVAQSVGDPYRTALVLGLLGRLEYCEHHYGRAQAYFEESLAVLRELGGTREVPFGLQGLAYTRLQQGAFNQAHALLCESVALYKSQGNPRGMAECLIGFGALASERGMPAEAARLLTAAVTLGGSLFMSLLRAEGMEYEHYLSITRAQLTEQEFEDALREGRNLTIEQAIEYALYLPLIPAGPTPKTYNDLGGLTKREREIAALIGRGKTNGEIAAELVLSKRTVEKHIANILSKLELTSRAQIVRWVTEHNLTNAAF